MTYYTADLRAFWNDLETIRTLISAATYKGKCKRNIYGGIFKHATNVCKTVLFDHLVTVTPLSGR